MAVPVSFPEENTGLNNMTKQQDLQNSENSTETPVTHFSARRGAISTRSPLKKSGTFVAINRLSAGEIESRRQEMKRMNEEFEAMDRK